MFLKDSETILSTNNRILHVNVHLLDDIMEIQSNSDH
jgi:hypothetical protein